MRNPSKEERERANRPLELIHTDLMGELAPRSYCSSNKHIVVFVDDYSRYAMAFAMQNKTQVHIYLAQYLKEMRRNLDNQSLRVNKIRTDNGTEFRTDEMKELKKEEGFEFDYSEPGTPEHNGASEQFNKTLQEKIRSLIFDAKMPKQFWNFALGYAVHVYNRSPHKALEFKTPYQMIFRNTPTLKYLRRFGCASYVKNLKVKGKFDERGTRGILIGCNETGYRVLIPETGKIVCSKHVSFIESVTYGSLQ